MPIALGLARRGHDVRWATGPDAAPKVAELGIEAVPMGLTVGARNAAFRAMTDLSDVPFERLRPVFFTGLFVRLAAPAMREGLRHVLDTFRPDIVVRELCELAVAPLAAARAIPCVTVAFSGAPYEAMIAPGRPAAADLWAEEGLAEPVDFGWFDHLYLHPWPAALGRRPEREHVAASWHMGFDGGLGPVPEWLAPLGKDRPLVYVTFGTEMGPIAPWPAVLDALSGVEADVLLTTGSSIDADAWPSVPSNVRVERYVPQGHVLDRAAAVVSHGGAGAVAAALERGVPQVLIPLGADQLDNASACSDAGVATALAPHERDAGSIAAALASALGEGSKFHTACNLVRDQIAAMGGPTVAVDLIEGLA